MNKLIVQMFLISVLILSISCKKEQKKPEKVVENKMENLAVLEYNIKSQLGEGAFGITIHKNFIG